MQLLFSALLVAQVAASFDAQGVLRVPPGQREVEFASLQLKGGPFRIESSGEVTLRVKGDVEVAATLECVAPLRVEAGGSLRVANAGVIAAPAVRLEGRQAEVRGRVEARRGRGGGVIYLLGDRVSVSGRLDASGELRGGGVYVGGSWQGKDPTVRSAASCTIASQAELDASATRGPGGEVVAWSVGTTRFHGSATASAGDEGDGGRIEVSGKSLDYDGALDVSASAGAPGWVLFDPTDIFVGANGADNAELADGEILSADRPGESLFVTPAQMNAVGGNVTLQATNSVLFQVGNPVALATPGASLTVQAGGSVVVNTSITTLNGELDLTATGTGVVTMGSTGSLSTGSANVDIQSGGNITLEDITTTGTVTLNSTSGGVVQASAGQLVTAGSLVVTNSNGITLNTSVDSLTTLSTGNQTIVESNGLTDLQLNAGTADLSLTLTLGGVVDTAADGDDLTAANATLTLADAASQSVGTSANALETAVASLSVNTSAGGGSQFLASTSGLTGMNLNAGTGGVTMTASGNLNDSDGAVDVIGGAVSFSLGTNIFGDTTNPIETTITELTVAAGGLFVTETDGLSGLDIDVGSGVLTLTAGGALTDSDAALDLEGTQITLTTANGGLGSVGNPLGIDAGRLITDTSAGNGSQFFNEAAAIVGINLNAGTGNVTLVCPQLLFDIDPATDIICNVATLSTTNALAPIGGGSNPIGLQVNELVANTSAGNGNQFFTEVNTLSSLSLNAGTGNVTLTTGGAISDTDGATDVTCNVATITATTGGIGSAGNPIGTAVTDLSVTTSNGDQFFSETDALAAVNMSSGTGGITYTGGGAVSDADGAVDFACGALSITLSAGGLGTSVNPIGTNAATLATNTVASNADQFLSETSGLTDLSLLAGTGDVTLAAGGTLEDTTSPAVSAATATFTLTSGTIGTNTANRLGAQVSANLIATTANANQFWDGLSGLPGVTLSAGTGAINITSTGAILDADGAADLSCSALTITGASLGTSANPLGLDVDDLTSLTAGSNGDQFLREANGLVALFMVAGTGGVSLSSVTGNVADGDGSVDVIGGVVAITVSAGSLGAAGNSIQLAASTSLAVDTSGGNGDQFLTSTGTLRVAAANGLNAGTGNVNLGAGTLLVNGSSTATLVRANGGTLGGTGTLGAVQINTGATLAPGTSPGVTNTGNLNLAAGSTTTMEIGGTSPGTGAGFHDQINVTGTATIDPTATLSMVTFGGFAPSAGDSFVLINNDGVDPITGTFQGLAEGAQVTGFLGSTLLGQVSYVGGDGNDLVVTAIPTADLAVSKTVSDAAPKERDRITYTVTMTNNGPADATSVQLTDALPTGVTLVTPTPSQGTYNTTSGLWTVGALTNGTSATLTLEVVVDDGTAGTTITNTTSGLSGTVLGGSTTDDTGSVAITVATAAAASSGGGAPLVGHVTVTKLSDKDGCSIGRAEAGQGWVALLCLFLALAGARFDEAGARARLS